MFQLETKRLRLRDLLESDLEAMHKLRSNPDVTRYIDYIESKSINDTREWISGTIQHNSLVPRRSYNLVIDRSIDRAIIGWIGLGQSSDQTKGDMNFGYALLPEYWGQGYVTEALTAIIDFAFDELGVVRIFGECHIKNFASARIMEKVGLRHQGVIGDQVQYAIERAE